MEGRAILKKGYCGIYKELTKIFEITPLKELSIFVNLMIYAVCNIKKMTDELLASYKNNERKINVVWIGHCAIWNNRL